MQRKAGESSDQFLNICARTANTYDGENKEALAIRRIFSLVDMITKAKFSNSPNDFKIRLFV